MKVAIVGLGRMGKNITLHLLEQGVEVVAYNRSRDDVDEVVAKGAKAAYTLAEIPGYFSNETAVVILYVPSGTPTEEVLFGNQGNSIKGLVDLLPKGSIIIDGGNSFFKDSQRRYKTVQEKGLYFLDMGTSGGLDGARGGACLMVGGDENIYRNVAEILEKVAVKDGYGYVGPSGAGHFVKMVHNGVEYGMMGALAEGFGIVHSSQFAVHSKDSLGNSVDEKFTFDLAKVAKIWSHGSIVSGLLATKAQSAFEKNATLDDIVGEVPKGETETEMEWLDTIGVANPVIQTARKQRVETRTKPSFIGKVIASLRREFGGHKVKEKS